MLSDDIEWTITRTSPISKTYTSRKQFLDEVIAPLSARLSKQITPKVRALYADGVTLSLHFGMAQRLQRTASLTTTIPTRGI